MKNNNLGIFMYSDTMKELCEYIDKYVGKIEICFTYKGMTSLSCLDKSTIINGRSVLVTTNIEHFIKMCSEVIVLPFRYQFETQNIYDDIKKIRTNGIVIRNPVADILCENLDNTLKNEQYSIKDTALKPIVVVLGRDYNESRDLCLLIKLRSVLMGHGYNVTCVSSDDFQVNFNVNIMPKDIISEISPSKIKNYFEDLSQNNEMDILLCELPDPFIDDQISIRNYCMLKAINPDVFIMNIMYNDYTEDMLDNISDIVLHRYGIQVDLFNISNVLKYTITNNSYLPVTLDRSCFKYCEPYQYDKYQQRVVNFDNMQEEIYEKLKACIGKKHMFYREY